MCFKKCTINVDIEVGRKQIYEPYIFPMLHSTWTDSDVRRKINIRFFGAMDRNEIEKKRDNFTLLSYRTILNFIWFF